MPQVTLSDICALALVHSEGTRTLTHVVPTPLRRPLLLLRTGCIMVAAALSHEATAGRKLGGASHRRHGRAHEGRGRRGRDGCRLLDAVARPALPGSDGTLIVSVAGRRAVNAQRDSRSAALTIDTSADRRGQVRRHDATRGLVGEPRAPIPRACVGQRVAIAGGKAWLVQVRPYRRRRALSPRPPLEGGAPYPVLRRHHQYAGGPLWNGGASPPRPARVPTESCLPRGSSARHPEVGPYVHHEDPDVPGRGLVDLRAAPRTTGSPPRPAVVRRLLPLGRRRPAAPRRRVSPARLAVGEPAWRPTPRAPPVSPQCLRRRIRDAGAL